jgi:hypothetical protein
VACCGDQGLYLHHRIEVGPLGGELSVLADPLGDILGQVVVVVGPVENGPKLGQERVGVAIAEPSSLSP